MKGQTWVEFIIATSVFLLAIGFIFITASDNIKEYAQKSLHQAACLKAYELEYFLTRPGVPANWTFSSGFKVFGLANSDNQKVIVSKEKWQAMKNFGFANVSQNSTPNKSWHINYNTYAFVINESIIDDNCIIGNAVTICRSFGHYSVINITANSTYQSKIKLSLFFPFSTINLIGSTNESNDVIQTTYANGTYLDLTFNINSSDEDSITFELLTNPKLAFINHFSFEGEQHLPFYLGNVLLEDGFGPLPPPNAMICQTKVNGLLNLTNESLLVSFDLEAW